MPSTAIRLDNMSYVIFFVKDTEKSLRFYRDTLGLAVKMESPDWVELSTGNTTLALHVSDQVQPMPAKSGAEVCFTVKDIQGAYAALKEKGVKFSGEPHVVHDAGEMEGVSANFVDLDGNHLAIFGMVAKKK